MDYFITGLSNSMVFESLFPLMLSHAVFYYFMLLLAVAITYPVFILRFLLLSHPSHHHRLQRHPGLRLPALSGQLRPAFPPDQVRLI